MTIQIDLGLNETRALFDLVDFSRQHVLEIGCGDGRLTWRFAHRAFHVMAIDPNANRIARAKKNMSHELRDRVEFYAHTFEDFAKSSKSSILDSAIFSWSF